MAQPIPEPCSRGLVEAEPCPREAGREPEFAAKRWALVATVLASSMAFIDSSALTVALPQIAQDFGADFVALARSVYQLNDQRGRIKRDIDILLGARFHEEKSHDLPEAEG